MTDNELIAEFMGFSKCVTEHDTFWKENGEECTINSWDFHSNNLKFDKSWDWLMPVVERIEQMRFDTYIQWMIDTTDDGNCNFVAIMHSDGNSLVYLKGESKIDTVYKAVLEFIKWHNQQKK